MMNTMEMRFCCSVCDTERQYGCAENFKHIPDERHPMIQCAGPCHKVTSHYFVRVRERGKEE